MPLDPVQRLRQICLGLPEVDERISHREPSWFIRRGRQFAMLSDHHHNSEHLAFTCPAALGVQDALVREAPEVFFVPRYTGYRGWVGVNLDVPPVDWDDVADLVTDAYRLVAPKRLLAQLDES